jgi:3-oxoacyl-[acyl-carrier-protein] synthase III
MSISERPRVFLAGLGGRVGSVSVTLHELAARYGLAVNKIEEKTGITGLRRFAPDESMVTIARDVAHEVLACSGAALGDVRAVFGSSNPTADDLLPTFTIAAAAAIGLRGVVADHIGTGCGGALLSMRNAYNQLVVDALDGRVGHALVIVGDHSSRIIDPESRHTATLFGEGVAVALLTTSRALRAGYEIVRVASKSLLNDAVLALRLRNPHALPPGSPLPKFEMEGRPIFEFGEHAVEHFLALLGLDRIDEKTYLVPHQPNLRMLEAMIARAGLDARRVYLEGIRTVGNTSGPAVLLGLKDALARGLVDADAPVVLGAFGAELQVGAALLHPVEPCALLGGQS